MLQRTIYNINLTILKNSRKICDYKMQLYNMAPNIGGFRAENPSNDKPPNGLKHCKK